MATAILEIFKLLKEEVGEEKAEKIVKIIEESIGTIREEAKAQKPILKAEIKEELKKELVTKEEFFGEIGKLEQKIEFVRREIRILFYVLLAFMFLLNKGTVEFAFKVLGLLK